MGQGLLAWQVHAHRALGSSRVQVHLVGLVVADTCKKEDKEVRTGCTSSGRQNQSFSPLPTFYHWPAALGYKRRNWKYLS